MSSGQTQSTPVSMEVIKFHNVGSTAALEQPLRQTDRFEMTETRNEFHSKPTCSFGDGFEFELLALQTSKQSTRLALDCRLALGESMTELDPFSHRWGKSQWCGMNSVTSHPYLGGTYKV